MSISCSMPKIFSSTPKAYSQGRWEKMNAFATNKSSGLRSVKGKVLLVRCLLRGVAQFMNEKTCSVQLTFLPKRAVSSKIDAVVIGIEITDFLRPFVVECVVDAKMAHRPERTRLAHRIRCRRNWFSVRVQAENKVRNNDGINSSQAAHEQNEHLPS